MIAVPTASRGQAAASDTTMSLATAPVRFDDNSRNSTSDQPMPPGGVLKALREAADMSGVDATAELYNEAIRYANEGHLRLAKERLNVLLGLTPDDADAKLLLAKLHVAGQRWQDALTALDEAQAVGAQVPVELRNAVEEHLRNDLASDEENTAALRAREAGEVKALRQEARRLRSENAELLGRTHDLERETKKWAWTTAGVAGIGLLFVAVNLLFSGPSPAMAEATVADSLPPIEGAVSAEGAAPAVAGAPVVAAEAQTPTAIADKARDALAKAEGLDDTELKVVVRGTSATVSGTVLTAKQRGRAKTVLQGVSGITAVDVAGVTILARTQGAEHVIGKGDTLGKIALNYYGESALSSKIEAANPGSKNLKIGQTLKLPAVGK